MCRICLSRFAFFSVCLCFLLVAAADGAFTIHGPGAEAGQIQRGGPYFWCTAAFASSARCAVLAWEILRRFKHIFGITRVLESQDRLRLAHSWAGQAKGLAKVSAVFLGMDGRLPQRLRAAPTGLKGGAKQRSSLAGPVRPFLFMACLFSWPAL